MQSDQNQTRSDGSLPVDALEVRMHCPKCMKLYSMSIGEFNDVEPQFRCHSCNTLFSISLRDALESNENLMGRELIESAHPDAAEAAIAYDEGVGTAAGAGANTGVSRDDAIAGVARLSKALFSCPKCGHSYASGDTECAHCGVLFLKFAERDRQEVSRKNDEFFTASKEVRQAWEDVLNNYDNFEVHRHFITAAWADRSLDYAAHKYGSILDVLPSDEIALKAQKELQALTSVRFEVSMESESSDGTWGQWLHLVNTFKAGALSLRRFKITNLIMVACGVIIMMGMAMPHMRNLIGFGSAILGFILALRYYFRVI